MTVPKISIRAEGSKKYLLAPVLISVNDNSMVRGDPDTDKIDESA